MTLRQLERLSKNPNYKLTHKQIVELEEYRNKQYGAKHKTSIIKHDVVIHDAPEDEDARAN